MTMDLRRVRLIADGRGYGGPVVYWMSRDQRVRDNWALLYARELAREAGVPLGVVFCLVPSFLGATLRQYGFMLAGLREVEQSLRKKNIPFFLLAGRPEREIPSFLKRIDARSLVTDFDPLRIKRRWTDGVAKRIAIPFYEVDAHNILPCWASSPKQEYGAYTIRPKIRTAAVDWTAALKSLDIDRSVPEVAWIQPGEGAAHRALRRFCSHCLASYGRDRNDPTQDGQSGLSPYLHFGQLSAQRVALAVLKAPADEESREAFLEELIVRRELSDNFCFFNPGYDTVDGFPDWAKRTLKTHRKDRREHVYALRSFEQARTHDDLWNAAQTEMVKTGKMHGYLRMYWAKKILEWTRSPEEAVKIAIALNDRYELDGRDPNGYAGIAWSIGGVHDRAWGERAVFGKVRYMSRSGAKSKFDIAAYIERVRRLAD
jgi:deoxyribodipyrimidine photo-lyase